MDNHGSESSFNFSSSSALHFPLVSNNSFEINAISLSDDSGFTSSQLNRENDHADFNSDEFEEFSQFDSDSGLSAENCHTIKKLPANTLIEPPPEFADNNFSTKFPIYHSSTPSTVIRTTHISSYASRMAQNIIAKAIRTFDRKHLGRKEIYCEKHAAAKLKKQQKQHKTMDNEYIHKNRFVTKGYSIYGSDSFLNSFNKNQNYHHHLMSNGKNSNSNINIDDEDIYDEPNTEYDVIYKDNKDTILCTKRIVRSLEKKKMESRHLYCNTATEEIYCGKAATKLRSHCATTATSPSIENKFQSNSFQKKFDKFLRSKFLNSNFTPTTTTSSIFYSFCRSGTNNSNPCYPNSRTSLNSRLSSSHNSLTKSSNKADDSMFITQAMSHDQLGKSCELNDFYNVPMDSDIYTLPIDVINQHEDDDEDEKLRRNHQHHHHHHHHRHRAMSDNNLLECSSSRGGHKIHNKHKRSKRKKRSDAGHMENGMRKMSSGNFVNSQSFSHEYNRVSNDRTKSKFTQTSTATQNGSNTNFDVSSKYRVKNSTLENSSSKSVSVMIKGGDDNNNKYSTNSRNTSNSKKSQFSISLNLKQKFCSIFRFRKSQQSPTRGNLPQQQSQEAEKKVNLSTRALPPLPQKENEVGNCEGNQSPNSDKKRETTMDFAANIEKVRECGWYWGALTSEAAEKILSNEPDGSFIVRDSSDLNYIFSLTVKLNGCIRHVRIEQEQGTFSFGTCAQQIKCSYKSRTIKEFIENAVEHSRSGRYLFFIHRRPEHGPMRVQLLNPVSRFKHIQSLQHMCRFVIVKAVQRKDLIETLPLPRRLLDYLQTKNFLSELIDSDSSSQSQIYGENNNNNNINSDSN